MVETGGTGGGFEETAVFAQTFLWDELGNPSSIGYPRCSHAGCFGSASNRTVAPHYSDGWLTDLPGYTNAPLGTAFTYHESGLPATIQHANGVQVIQANDPDGMRRPSSITTTGAEQNWASGAYAFDGSGNIIRMGDDYFLYDAVSRIKESRVADPSVAGIPRRYQSFEYDLYGNRTKIGDRTGSTSWTYRTYTTSTSTNRLSGWSFDAAGNQLTGPGGSGAFTYSYDLANQMQTLTGVGADERYVYTADDERLYTEDQNTGERLWTLRDLGGLVLTEYRQDDDAWFWERDYIHRSGQLFASQGRGEGYLTHYHLDHLGTPRLVTRGGGGGTGGAAVLGIYAYHPFGEEASQAQQEDIRLRFTGHERDGRGAGFADDLDYMHARYYSPGVGRFLSVDPDPQSVDPRRPQSWNKYSYVLGNPLVYVDPRGERWFKVDGEWVFFEGTDTIEEVTVTSDGTSTSRQVEGKESVVTFDGGTLTLFKGDGTTVSLEARAGSLDANGRSQPDLQGVRDVGPLPEGAWSFNPQEIQSYSSTSLVDRLKGLLARGPWPGGTSSWGEQRVWLEPLPGTDTRGRSGFTIHGGARFGSRGCIDLCTKAPDFFGAVDRSLDMIPVYVDYPDGQ